jgi:hypothetical protein
MSTTSTTGAASSTKGSSKKSRSVSPGPSKSSEKKTKATTTPKTKEKTATPRSTKKAAVSSEKKVRGRPKKQSGEEDGEEISTMIITEELENLFNLFLVDMLSDSTALQNVIRIQYVQCYFFAIALLASCLFPASVPVMAFYKGASELALGVTGCLGLAQAFSLTAAAQTGYSAMKKALQYNMFFHFAFAFIVIVKADKLDPQIIQDVPYFLHAVVGSSVLNIALNMWACYFREVSDELEEEAEEMEATK